ncbi:hypothetical protein OTK59_24030, partial [Vibrio natriegens]|uniref:hypothetical protein n=1 Tax=Vibrio natriegens TaxID=691 RepID=UPI0022847CF2
MARNSRNLYSFTNTIKWRIDRESWQSVKKQSQKLARDLEKINPQKNVLNGSSKRRKAEQDSHIKHYRSLQKEQAKFEAKQKQVLKRFVQSTSAIR